MVAKRAAKKAVKAEPEVPVSAASTIATWKIIVAVAVLGVVLAAAVLWSTGDSTYQYNGFTFSPERCPDGSQGCWSTQVVLNVGVRPILFYNGPRDVEDVLVSPGAVQRVLDMVPTANGTGRVTIAFDEGVPGEVGIAAHNLARITGEKVYRIPTSGAVYGNVTCTDGSAHHAVVYLTQTDVESVRVTEQGCVILGAPTTTGLIDVVDAFSYHLLGIIR